MVVIEECLCDISGDEGGPIRAVDAVIGEEFPLSDAAIASHLENEGVSCVLGAVCSGHFLVKSAD